MTTQTVFGIAGPFADLPGERLEPATEFRLVDKVTREDLVLPAGNIVTEIAVRRRATQGNVTFDLTPGRGIAVGLNGDARKFTGTPGVITDDLNMYDVSPSNPNVVYPAYHRSFPNIDISDFSDGLTQDKFFVLQSSFGGTVVEGGVSVVIKYKPFSDSVAVRWGNPPE